MPSSLPEPRCFDDSELAKIRAEFPILQTRGRGGREIAYLDSCATSQRPRSVVEAIENFYYRHNAAVNRGTHYLGDESTAAFESAREVIAEHLGRGNPDEIIWTKNATEAMNLLAYGFLNASLPGASIEAKKRFGVGVGDEIVVTRAEHHANLVPWQQLCERTGATLKWLELTPEGEIDLDTLNIINERTRLVAVTHLSNVTGMITPLEPIIVAARAVGALIAVDTCQSAAHLPISMRGDWADFAVFSGHKMLGPTGIGALWGKSELLEHMPPMLTGGSMVAEVTMEKTSFQSPPLGLEAGSQPVAQAVGWATAIRYIEKLGPENIYAHEAYLMRILENELAEIPGIRVLGPQRSSKRAAVIAFDVPGVHPHDVGQYLDYQDLAVRVGHHCAQPLHRHFGLRSSTRASLAPFTTEEEIDRLVDGIKGVSRYFGTEKE